MIHTKSREENKRQLLFLLFKVIHYLGITVLFFVAWMLFRYRSFAHIIHTAGFRYNYFVVIGYFVLLLFFNRVYNSYLLGYKRIRNLLFSQFLAQLFSVVIVYIVVTIAWAKFYNPVVFISMLVAQLLFSALWSFVADRIFFHFNPSKKTILIYRNETDRRRFGSVEGKPMERLYQITEELCFDGNEFWEIADRVKGYDAIFVAGVSSRCRNGIAKYCQENHIDGFFLPHVGDVIMQGAEHIQSFDSPVLKITTKKLKPEYGLIKRAFDIIASALVLIIFSPTILVTSIVIKAHDGGPVFYRQTRLTKGGKEFRIFKFRSMRVDAEKDGVARLSSGDKDERITQVGRYIRRWRVDELPQLINILKGDMSIVGPRPERPEIAEQYYKTMPDFRLRLQVRAGLTGYAQVYGRYNTSPYEKLEFDLLYINNMGVLTDLQLMFATFGILFKPESTKGVEEGQVTAIDTSDE